MKSIANQRDQGGKVGCASGRVWRLTLAGLLLAASLPCQAPAAGPGENLGYSEPVRRVADILEKIKANYAEPIDDDKLVSDAVNGVLHRLDPHSVYLNAEEFGELYGDTRGEYAGIGVEVRVSQGHFKITSVFDEGPAAHAGVQPGDVILAIDGVATQGWALDKLIQQVRGDAGKAVELTLARGSSDPVTLNVTRDLVHGRSVFARSIEPGYAYVRLSQFQVRTPESLVASLKRLRDGQHGRLAGIVLDLRDNPGGLLSAAVGVAATFLPGGATVVVTDGLPAHSKQRLAARRETYMRLGAIDHLREAPAELKTLPLVVLVNGGSASASEIVAGALQDHKRATILGTRTYGKGSVQVVIPLGDGTGLKLTTAYYHTPAGRSIQGKGLTPDVVVEAQHASASGSAAQRAVAALEHPGQAPIAHPNAAGCSAADPSTTADIHKTPLEQDVLPIAGSVPVDCQLERAIELLHSQSLLAHS